MYIYDNISLNSFQNEKCFRQSCTEIENTDYMFNNVFPETRALYEITWNIKVG
jgi:hypothetical protein